MRVSGCRLSNTRPPPERVYGSTVRLVLPTRLRPQGLAASLPARPALQWRMPALTRRRSPDHSQECWLIYYGDVQVGAIAERTGDPHNTEPWEWRCGFYPGSRPGECTSGTAETFDEARADFEAVWKVFLSNRTEADFQEWRDQRDWTARKYAIWKAGERMPSQRPSSIMRCACGETFDSHRPDEVLIHVPHITATQRAHEIRHTEPIR
jgi:hypothetical protein